MGRVPEGSARSHRIHVHPASEDPSIREARKPQLVGWNSGHLTNRHEDTRLARCQVTSAVAITVLPSRSSHTWVAVRPDGSPTGRLGSMGKPAPAQPAYIAACSRWLL